ETLQATHAITCTAPERVKSPGGEAKESGSWVILAADDAPAAAWFKTPATGVPPEGSCVCARSAMQSIKCLRQRGLRPWFVDQDSTAGVTLFSTMPAPALR